MAHGVHVLVRFRPLKGAAEAVADKVGVNSGQSEVTVGGIGKRFTYDAVFDGNASNEEVYKVAALPLLESVLQGYHGTILAYGQTGSGKTHTMMGPDGATNAQSLTDAVHAGIIPRMMRELFENLQKLPVVEYKWAVQMTCYEIYKETIRDLLATEAEGNKEYRIRQDFTGQRGIYVENLTVHNVNNMEAALALLTQAAQNRATAATAANDSSSRSHSLVTVDVMQTNLLDGGLRTMGRLNLVDLAGSEKVAKTRADGERLREAQKINLSLALLGNVIYKLTDGKSVHIPYRDSKLTRLLQESLGGNSKTCLLCMCSPAAADETETVNTLLFANRAKHIQNKPEVHKELGAGELNIAYLKVQEELRLLKERMATLEKTPAPSPAASHEPDDDHEEQQKTINSLLKELEEVRAELFEKEEQLQAAMQKVNFYRIRSETADASAKEWKEKYTREKKACDMWLRKYTELSPAACGRAKEKAKHSVAKGPARSKSLAGHNKDVNFMVSGSHYTSGPAPPPRHASSTGPPPTVSRSQSIDVSVSSPEPSEPDAQVQLAATLLQLSELQSLSDQQKQDLLQQEERLRELTLQNTQLASCISELQELEERRSALIDELTRTHENHKLAWINKQRENEVLLAEIEAMRADIRVADIPTSLKETLLGSATQDMEVPDGWDEPTLLEQLSKTLSRESSQREVIEIVALDIMVKTELLLDVGNDSQLLSRISGPLTSVHQQAAKDALDKVLEAGAFLAYEKRILSSRTFATPELDSERGNCITELEGLLKKAQHLGRNLSNILQKGRAA